MLEFFERLDKAAGTLIAALVVIALIVAVVYLTS